MPPWCRLPRVMFDGHVSEAIVECSDCNPESVRTPSTVAHQGFEPVTRIVDDEHVAHRAESGRYVAGFADPFLCTLYVLAPLVAISQRCAISPRAADAMRVHRGSRAKALSSGRVMCERLNAAQPVRAGRIAGKRKLIAAPPVGHRNSKVDRLSAAHHGGTP